MSRRGPIGPPRCNDRAAYSPGKPNLSRAAPLSADGAGARPCAAGRTGSRCAIVGDPLQSTSPCVSSHNARRWKLREVLSARPAARYERENETWLARSRVTLRSLQSFPVLPRDGYCFPAEPRRVPGLPLYLRPPSRTWAAVGCGCLRGCGWLTNGYRSGWSNDSTDRSTSSCGQYGWSGP